MQMKDSLYLPDLGNGTYQNPVLFCDYSDPDVIRVGDTYYLTASSFNYVPGLPILTSKDLVNWTLVNYALKNIPEERYSMPQHAQGVWAPAIRWHDGWFYIFYGMPDEGIFMVRTQDALGEWEAPVCLLPGKGLIDPCPFWDEDGTAWVVHGYARSRIGFKSFLGMFPMSPDATRAIGEDHLIYNGLATQPTIEGPKIYRRGEYIYIFAPAGGVATGWQTVLRAKNIHGPYEEKIVLEQDDTEINGPHQGGWVTTPDGQDWFMHFQSRGLYGRIVHLQPMHWGEDGWPIMGDNGKPVIVYEKPHGPVCERTSEQASDTFEDTLGLQWQFMGNWREDFFSLEKPGMLRLFAHKCGKNLWQCPQALTQKVACSAFTATVNLNASSLLSGEQAGLALIGGQYAYAALRRSGDGFHLVYVQSAGQHADDQLLVSVPVSGSSVTLCMTLRPTGYDQAEAVFAYSTDGEHFSPIGSPFSPERHTWVGARCALMCMPYDRESSEIGSAEFGPFIVTKEDDE